MEILNTYHVPVPVRANAKGAGFLAVLTQGAAGSGDQAVYIGIAGNLGDVDALDYEIRRIEAAGWIAHSGLKQSYRDAIRYFPGLAESDYRA